MRLPIKAIHTDVFIMRISPEIKSKLNELSKNKKYGGTASSAIRVLINSAIENLD